MSTSSSIYLIAGLITIFLIYKKVMTDNNVNFTIRLWSKPEDKNSLKLRKAQIQKETFRITAILSAIGFVLLITNTAYDYLSGWYVLGILGIFYSYCYYLVTGISYQSLSSYINENQEERLKATNLLQAVKKTSLIILVVAIGISGNWAYQVQKNQGEQKLDAMNNAVRLVGNGQCANFFSQEAVLEDDGTYESINSGGWPCIKVGSVTNMRFTNSNNKFEMCLNYSLKRSYGLPSESDNLIDYDFRSLCADYGGSMWSSGWSEQGLLDLVLKDLKKEVDALQIQMCQTYYPSLNYEEKYIYCDL